MESHDQNLGRLVEEYHRRVALGQQPKPEDFRHEAGVDYTRFLAILEQEALLDDVLEGTAAETYPRTFGEYTLIGALGRGGIGNVYKAVHRPLSRTVALKVLQGGWAGEPELVDRFQRGARAAAQVEHDHVVRIYDVGVFEGRPFIAMSYVEGASLQQVFRSLREVGPPPFGPTHHRVLDGYGIPGEGQHTAAFVHRIARLLADPVDALAAYHDAGIIHRDVKPGNLLIDADGRLVLTDFDLARRLETNFQTRSGGNIGTPGYMSPEQWDPLIPEVDGRADLYAFGCVLFEAFAQRPPFEAGNDPSRMMKRVLQENAPDPAQLVPGLPVAAKRVILKALERRREDRYQTAPELRADLAALGRGGDVAARPVPVTKRVARWGWGKKWAVLALIAVAGSALWYARRPATLHIAPRPAADVWIGDHNVGRSPVSHDVRAGTHVVKLERSGFKPEVFHVEIQPGESELIDPRLVVVDENDPEVREAFFEQTGIRLPDMEIGLDRAQTGDYADGPHPALPLFPRGKVRTADLTTFAAELYRPVTADVLFLDADGAVVLERSGVYGTNSIKLEFTDEDRARFANGATYRWELRVDGTPTSQATFTLVDGPPEDRLFKVRDVVTHPKLRDLFEIGFWSKEGLHVTAFRKALDGWQKHQALEFLELGWASLKSLGIQDSGYARSLLSIYADAKAKDDG